MYKIKAVYKHYHKEKKYTYYVILFENGDKVYVPSRYIKLADWYYENSDNIEGK